VARSEYVPFWAGRTGLVDDVLGGAFCAFEPTWDTHLGGAADLAPGFRSVGVVARGNALALASTEAAGPFAIVRMTAGADVAELDCRVLVSFACVFL
jgi:hypothetical protein